MYSIPSLVFRFTTVAELSASSYFKVQTASTFFPRYKLSTRLISKSLNSLRVPVAFANDDICKSLAADKGFGTRTVKKAWTKVDRRINQAVINQEQLKNQEIITSKKVDDKLALGLIASYLPDLLNDGYTHLLN